MEHSREYYMRVKKRIRKRRIRFLIISLILALAIALSVFACNGGFSAPENPDKPNIEQGEAPDNTPAPDSSEPYVVSTATLGSSGDILIHEAVFNAAYKNGEYDFSNILTRVSPYFKKYDYMVANLEVTLGGQEAGKYRGYPGFNCPDSVVNAFKEGGVDLFLTANNHSYDTGLNGLLRTQMVLKENGVDYIGTRSDTTESSYIIKDINGIKVGMAVYTYETETTPGRKALNGIVLSAEASPLVNSFNYKNLPAFYSEAETVFKEMKEQGADAVVFYMHWGNEYQRVIDKNQKIIAQKLSDIGVDVIVGGHPHTIQPFEMLKGKNGNETACIYSVGNLVSNQRKALMDSDGHSGHTEDGMIFGVTFEKWSNGVTEISDISVLPLWVNLKTVSGKRVYEIAPLDTNIKDWSTLGLSSAISQAKASYNRTMKLVGAPINEFREAKSLPKYKTVIE